MLVAPQAEIFTCSNTSKFFVKRNNYALNFSNLEALALKAKTNTN